MKANFLRTVTFFWLLIAFGIYLYSLKIWYGYINSPTMAFEPNMNWQSWLNIAALYSYPLLLAACLYYGYHLYSEERYETACGVLLVPFIIVLIVFKLGLI